MSAPKKPASVPSTEELVTSALNEQGFLLGQVVRAKVRGGLPGQNDAQSYWQYVGSEYPVTAADGSQTRIDLVLGNGASFLCLECKRPHPEYKRWIFFDQQQPTGDKPSVGFEVFRINRWPLPLNPEAYMDHRMEPNVCPSSCPVFDAYLEVAIKRDGKGGTKASHTETIEDSFRQVIRGQTGLLSKVSRIDSAGCWRSIPVVVTTAHLFGVSFEVGNVSLSHGMIDAKNLTLTPLRFCAVNYHADDNLSLRSAYAPKIRGNIQQDLNLRQIRTVFVVHAQEVNRFLVWLQNTFFPK